MTDHTITIFGCWWCGDCSWVRRYFEKNNIQYNWVDIDKDESGEEFVLASNHGMRSVPTIVFADGSVLVEPSVVDLQKKLGTALPTS